MCSYMACQCHVLLEHVCSLASDKIKIVKYEKKPLRGRTPLLWHSTKIAALRSTSKSKQEPGAVCREMMGYPSYKLHSKYKWKISHVLHH